MLWAAPLIASLAVGASGVLELGLGLEARGRHSSPPTTAAGETTYDLGGSPRLTVRLVDGANSVEATYAPRFTASDLGPHQRLDQMHEGELRLRLQPVPSSQVEVFATGGLGRTDLVSTRGLSSTTDPARPVATATVVDLERLRAGVSLRSDLDPRSQLTLSGAAYLDGGRRTVDQVAFPVEKGLEAAAGYRWSVTRRDRLHLQLTAQAARIEDRHTSAAWSTALALWRREAIPSVEVRAGAGLLGLWWKTRGPDPADPGSERTAVRRQGRPAAEAGVSSDTRPVGGQATLRLGAGADRVTGEVSQQADGSAGLRWALSEHVGLTAGASGTVAWLEAGTSRRTRFEAGGSWAATPRIRLDLGLYHDRQSAHSGALPSFTEYGAYASMRLDAPPVNW